VHHQAFVDNPLSVAQLLCEQQGTVRSICVQGTSDHRIEQVGSELEALLSEATVNTPEDLAAWVSSSLSWATSLVTDRGGGRSRDAGWGWFRRQPRPDGRWYRRVAPLDCAPPWPLARSPDLVHAPFP
jgi:hypothetical protein